MALNVLPATFNYDVPQSADFNIIFEYDDDWDLTGYTAASNWYLEYGGASQLELTSAAGEITFDLVAKTITIIITDADTSGMTDYEFVHHLFLTDGSGNKDYILKGHVKLIEA